MAKDPAMLWYWNDWHSGTVTLSRFLKGCYIDLLHAQFNSGHLSLEDVKTVLGPDFSQSWDILKKKFEQDSAGLFFNKRLEEEKNKRMAFTKSRRDNKLKSLTYDRSHEKHMIHHMENENENINTTTNTTISNKIEFSVFWDKYEKKVGARDCKKKWDKIPKETQEEILEHLDVYIPATPDPTYRKNPATYLNQEAWNDEIIPTKEKTLLPRFI
jgi:hypothetical protein